MFRFGYPTFTYRESLHGLLNKKPLGAIIYGFVRDALILVLILIDLIS